MYGSERKYSQVAIILGMTVYTMGIMSFITHCELMPVSIVFMVSAIVLTIIGDLNIYIITPSHKRFKILVSMVLYTFTIVILIEKSELALMLIRLSTFVAAAWFSFHSAVIYIRHRKRQKKNK
ncbi:MAG: hypothetical protein LR001_05660 [Clostridiales bacterium]|nr:hypothetical protein [Clostridiales bacterium]